MSVVSASKKRPSIRIPLPRNRLPWQSARLSSILLLISLLIIAGLMLLPPIYLLIRSIGAGNEAIALLLRPRTAVAVGQTLILAASVTLAAAALALPLAWLTACTDLHGGRFWTVAAALPLVLPSFVIAYLTVSIYGPGGLAQQLLAPVIGLQRLPSIYGFPGAFLVLTLLTYPFTFLTTRSALKRMDASLSEAARGLGLSPMQVFLRVTITHLRPAIVAGSLLVALYVLRDFGAVATMHYNTFTRLIYVQYQSMLDRSVAATSGMLLVLLTAIVVYLDMRTRSKAKYGHRSVGTARRPKHIRLGYWQWPALFFVASIVTIALIIPAAGLLYWLVQGITNGQSLSNISNMWLPTWNSISVSLIAAGITVLAALPIAYASVRRPGKLSRLAERLSYAGFALPGIVIALAFVFFGVTFARSLYQSLFMLLVAYLILFIPQSVGPMRASLLQIPSSLIDK
jgi:iron(III) transport system permease protein